MKAKTKIAVLAAVLALTAGQAAHAESYTVKPGDSLWKIARAHSVSVGDLKQANRLSADTIYPGQTLQIPRVAHTVRAGETMWTISLSYQVPLARLIAANSHIADPNRIRPGMTVYVPTSGPNAVQGANVSVSRPSRWADGRFPLPKGRYQQPLVNNYQEMRAWSPEGQTVRSHEGVDIFADKGTPVYSALDGEIVNFGWNEYGGLRVTVRVDSTTVFYYAHLSGYASGIGMGSKVQKGQLLGYVGDTGYGPVGTEGKFLPHLHFGIYKTDAPSWYSVDPYPYLKWWEANL